MRILVKLFDKILYFCLGLLNLSTMIALLQWKEAWQIFVKNETLDHEGNRFVRSINHVADHNPLYPASAYYAYPKNRPDYFHPPQWGMRQAQCESCGAIMEFETGWARIDCWSCGHRQSV